eukprot:2007059-Pyramimonas_sp.AAC.1
MNEQGMLSSTGFHGAQGWLNPPRCLSRVREERLERSKDGTATDVVEVSELEGLLVPLQDGRAGLALDVQAHDGHGVAVDLALGAIGLPSLLRISMLEKLEEFLALDLGADLLGGFVGVEVDGCRRARGVR